jgi:hypothetical protein
MKSSKLLKIVTLSGFSMMLVAAPGLAADAGEAAVVATDGKADATRPPVSEESATLKALLIKEQEVRTRLRMPAMLQVSEDPSEEEEIQELYRSGWIIEASLEEVEAAIKAAAATPSPDDDVAAKILAHRASCRFFMDNRK